MSKQTTTAKAYKISEYTPGKEPFYLDVAGETKLFQAGYEEGIPIMLKGPTGCGKSRLVEYMAHKLNTGRKEKTPLVTVPCHEDLTADDLKGRYLLDGSYQDGPALIAVKTGGILYLDEIVEARADTTVVMHPLGDHRKTLTIEKLGEIYIAPETFGLVISYNPGYQRKTKDLKMSTKQRFMAINMTYPQANSGVEAQVLTHEAQIDEKTAQSLVRIGDKLRQSKGKGLDEGVSTRLLIHAGKLIRKGIEPLLACETALINPITDNIDSAGDIRKGLVEVVKNFFA